ncbi:hypothetical protein AJ80_09481 [Polytolypa hystricis UAMH7299]|uniref:Uncharacterized protein n=1 Tax=Polytolypa hystricis (strain UAMH7299) TaxID=1447883 RepID=A0A2B7WQ49_POLH7|nr:hypothetical protein AJ80_09481 [Polytolypa hystricis UAMH7299]
MDTCNRIIEDYDTISEQCLDFKALLQTLPQLSKLRHITFTELMAQWISLFHGPLFHNGMLSSELDTFRFESPAMREWSGLVFKTIVERLEEEPSIDLKCLQPLPERAVIPLLVAFQVLQMELQLYCADAAPESVGRRTASP